MKVRIRHLSASTILISIFTITPLIYLGCAKFGSKEETSKICLQVNNYRMSLAEFEDEYSNFFLKDKTTSLNKRDFLEGLITRKVLLQEAQRQGLDKEREFLKAIEDYWEHSLLKLLLERKAKEISSRTHVYENEIERRYEEMIESGQTDKPFSKLHDEIKWRLKRQKETEQMDNWIAGLKETAKIEIDKEALGIE